MIDWLVQKELQYDGSPIVEDLDRRDPFPLAFDYHMPESYQGGDYNEDQWPAVACASQYDEDGALVRWIMEYDEPDAKHDDRRWHSTVCLERMGGRSGDADGDEVEGSTEPEACHVMMQTTCRPLANATEPLPDTIAAPALLRSFINLPWYVAKGGTTQLQTVPNKLSPQTFVHFSEALTDPGRKIPLVLFSTGYDGKIPEQAKQLARRALGNANVYVLDWSNEELREQVQTLFERGTSAGEYACPRSSCRMYMPGVDLSDPHHSHVARELEPRGAREAAPLAVRREARTAFPPLRGRSQHRELRPCRREPRGRGGRVRQRGRRGAARTRPPSTRPRQRPRSSADAPPPATASAIPPVDPSTVTTLCGNTSVLALSFVTLDTLTAPEAMRSLARSREAAWPLATSHASRRVAPFSAAAFVAPTVAPASLGSGIGRPK